MDQKKIDRINELAKLAKQRELTAEEQAERTVLREEYIAAFRGNLEAQLKSIAGAQNVKRLSGAGRCETSTAIAREFFPSTDTIVVATAFNFADALAGGPLAADTGAPVILLDTNKKVLTNDLIDYMNSAGVEHVIVLGGEAAVRSELFRAFQGYLK